MGVVLISNHVLEVKCVLISLLPLVGYNSLIYNHMKLSSDYSRHFSAIFDTLLVFFLVYKVSYNYYIYYNQDKSLGAFCIAWIASILKSFFYIVCFM